MATDQKRRVVLDTETTGLEPTQGHRVIEVGCVEMIGRQLTGKNLHLYMNPQCHVSDEVIAVHGITNEFLADKPVFADIAAEMMTFLDGAELIIHNAAFDVGFLDHELTLLGVNNQWGKLADHCEIQDTLSVARKRHPGQRNSLDALCKRYDINNAHRTLHGALLDAELLADVYLAMTGGQISLGFDAAHEHGADKKAHASQQATRVDLSQYDIPVIKANAEELAADGRYRKRLRGVV